MQLIISTPSLAVAHQARALLESEEISCLLEGEDRNYLAGAIPAQDCWIKLYVRNEGDAVRARSLLAKRPEKVEGMAWSCPVCGEHIEARFAACWKCASPGADEVATPNLYQGLITLVGAAGWILIGIGLVCLLYALTGNQSRMRDSLLLLAAGSAMRWLHRRCA